MVIFLCVYIVLLKWDSCEFKIACCFLSEPERIVLTEVPYTAENAAVDSYARNIFPTFVGNITSSNDASATSSRGEFELTSTASVKSSISDIPNVNCL